jgi:myo-inositol-1(or 4)-monophosphatase
VSDGAVPGGGVSDPGRAVTGGDTDEAAELRELAVELVTEAGARALELRAAGVEVANTKSSRTDVVTRADLAVETLVRERLAARRPHDVVLGEEEGGSAAPSGVCQWVLDPIDGTVNYLYGIPTWGVSLAVRRNGRTLAAAVADPPRREIFAAGAGIGATLTTGALSSGIAESVTGRHTRTLRLDPAAAPADLGTALVGTGFGYTAAARAADGLVAARLLPRVRDIRRIGVASLDLCSVAAGRLDAYYERGLNDWDQVGGVLVAAEAGAVVLGRSGAAPGRQLVLAAVPAVAGSLLEVLETFWADPETVRPELD